MQRAQLVNAVESKGMLIPSDDKERYLGTILWRNRDTFVNVPGKGYTLEALIGKESADIHRLVAVISGTDGDVIEDEQQRAVEDFVARLPAEKLKGR